MMTTMPALDDRRSEVLRSLIDLHVQTGEPVICQDVSKDPRFFSGVDHQTGFRTRSLLCAPLVHAGAVIGAIEVVNPEQPEAMR